MRSEEEERGGRRGERREKGVTRFSSQIKSEMRGENEAESPEKREWKREARRKKRGGSREEERREKASEMHMQPTLGKRSRRRLSSNVSNVSDLVLRMSFFEMLPCACFSHLFCLRLLFEICLTLPFFCRDSVFLMLCRRLLFRV